MGGPLVDADVTVRGGRIEQVGHVSRRGIEEIDGYPAGGARAPRYQALTASDEGCTFFRVVRMNPPSTRMSCPFM